MNPHINEITALYWIWKNTNHSIIGFNHYRRYFTEFDSKDLLTAETAVKTLEDYDICLWHYFHYSLVYSSLLGHGRENLDTAIEIIKKHMAKLHPDYIDSFDYILKSDVYFVCNMFITRRNIFDAYCEWLFSFFIDASKEIIETLKLDEKQGNFRRLPGFFSELMLNTWIIKNNLRVKDMHLKYIMGV